MDPKTILSRGGVFLLVLAVSLAAFGAGTSLIQPEQPTDSASASAEDITIQTFQPDTILASTTDDSGTISMDSNASGETVLIDMAHRNDVTETQLGPVIRTLTENGAAVTFVTREQARGDAFNASLRQADAYISIGPQDAYSTSQIDGLEAFADAGGRVLLLQEPNEMSIGIAVLFGQSRSTQQPAPMAPLASEFGLTFGNGYLYNMAENDNNYRSVYASPASGGDLTEGVERVSVLEGTTVTGGTSVLETTGDTTLSTTRESGTYSLVARSGNATAVGDTSLLTETGYQDADNEVLVGNLLDFLVSGEKVPEAPAPPEPTTPGGSTGGERKTPTPPPQSP